MRHLPFLSLVERVGRELMKGTMDVMLLSASEVAARSLAATG